MAHATTDASKSFHPVHFSVISRMSGTAICSTIFPFIGTHIYIYIYTHIYTHTYRQRLHYLTTHSIHKPNYTAKWNVSNNYVIHYIHWKVYLVWTIFGTVDRHIIHESFSRSGGVKSYVSIWVICENIDVMCMTWFHCEHTYKVISLFTYKYHLSTSNIRKLGSHELTINH